MAREIKHVSIPDNITKQIAISLSISEDIIEKIITHQWQNIRKAIPLHSTIEISNLGVFHLRPRKVQKEIEKFLAIKNSLERKLLKDPFHSINIKKLEQVKGDLEYLLQKKQQIENEQV